MTAMVKHTYEHGYLRAVCGLCVWQSWVTRSPSTALRRLDRHLSSRRHRRNAGLRRITVA